MPNIERPQTLTAVPSESKERVWILPFGLIFDKAILDPTALNYDLQVDTSPTFSSANAKNLSKTSAQLSAFQEGAVGKAFEVALPGRIKDADVTWYWRMRINSGVFVSAWTDAKTFEIPRRNSISETAEIFEELADENSYSKETSSSNVYKVLLQAGRELDLLDLEKNRTVADLVIERARDTALNNTFSEYLSLARVSTEPAAHHRWKTVKLWRAFMNLAGTQQGMIESVIPFVAEPPDIVDLTATEGWVLDQHYLYVPDRSDISPVIILYSRPQMGHSWILNVWNSWDLTYDQNVLEFFIRRQNPAHAQLTINYPTGRHWAFRYDRQADWDLWTNSGTLDTSTNPGTVRISAGQTTGTLTSPVERIATVSAYEAPEMVQDTVGQTVLWQYRTSSDGSSFSSYVTLSHGVVPDSSIAISQYIQFRLTLTRTASGAPNPIVSKFEFRGLRT